jgi:photosynthetic reaction center cytochrome c subunit
MKLGLSRGVGALVAAGVFLLSLQSARGQAKPEQKPLMAEDVFKNVQVLKGIPVDQFMGTMGFIAAALSMNCSECHITTSLEKYADDTPMKLTARRMILMMNAFNKLGFAGKRMVTCYTCHRGNPMPKVTPSLAEQYGTPPPDDPNEVEIEVPPAAGPSADQVLDKYIQALGGTEQVARLTSFVGKGTYESYERAGEKVPLEVYAEAPDLRTTVVHLGPGDDLIKSFDGKSAWTTSAGSLLSIPVIAVTGGELEGAKLDAEMSFPGKIKQALTGLRTGFPSTAIDDNSVEVVEGTNAGNTPVKLYFDKKSGLLVRLVRYTDTTIGLIPTQIDYSDYRDVSGVKLPFRWVTTWTDGRSSFELSDVRPNVQIDAAKFGKPAASAPVKQ